MHEPGSLCPALTQEHPSTSSERNRSQWHQASDRLVGSQECLGGSSQHRVTRARHQDLTVARACAPGQSLPRRKCKPLLHRCGQGPPLLAGGVWISRYPGRHPPARLSQGQGHRPAHGRTLLGRWSAAVFLLPRLAAARGQSDVLFLLNSLWRGHQPRRSFRQLLQRLCSTRRSHRSDRPSAGSAHRRIDRQIDDGLLPRSSLQIERRRVRNGHQGFNTSILMGPSARP